MVAWRGPPRIAPADILLQQLVGAGKRTRGRPPVYSRGALAEAGPGTRCLAGTVEVQGGEVCDGSGVVVWRGGGGAGVVRWRCSGVVLWRCCGGAVAMRAVVSYYKQMNN